MFACTCERIMRLSTKRNGVLRLDGARILRSAKMLAVQLHVHRDLAIAPFLARVGRLHGDRGARRCASTIARHAPPAPPRRITRGPLRRKNHARILARIASSWRVTISGRVDAMRRSASSLSRSPPARHRSGDAAARRAPERRDDADHGR
jgi:hypothetical protein